MESLNWNWSASHADFTNDGLIHCANISDSTNRMHAMCKYAVHVLLLCADIPFSKYQFSTLVLRQNATIYAQGILIWVWVKVVANGQVNNEIMVANRQHALLMTLSLGLDKLIIHDSSLWMIVCTVGKCSACRRTSVCKYIYTYTHINVYKFILLENVSGNGIAFRTWTFVVRLLKTYTIDFNKTTVISVVKDIIANRSVRTSLFRQTLLRMNISIAIHHDFIFL